MSETVESVISNPWSVTLEEAVRCLNWYNAELAKTRCERDAAIDDAREEREENQKHCACEIDPAGGEPIIECRRHATVRAERDEAIRRAENAEEAVVHQWWYADDDGNYGCRRCGIEIEHPEDWDYETEPIDFPHNEVCLVREIQERKSAKPQVQP